MYCENTLAPSGDWFAHALRHGSSLIEQLEMQASKSVQLTS